MNTCPQECGQCHLQCHCSSLKALACQDCKPCLGRENEAVCAPCVKRCSSYAICAYFPEAGGAGSVTPPYPTTPEPPMNIGGPGFNSITPIAPMAPAVDQSLQARFGNLESRVTKLEMQQPFTGPTPGGPLPVQDGAHTPQATKDKCHGQCMTSSCSGGCLDCMKNCKSEDCAKKCIMGPKCSADCKKCHLSCHCFTPEAAMHGPTGEYAICATLTTGPDGAIIMGGAGSVNPTYPTMPAVMTTPMMGGDLGVVS
jgi:hypothetical protein